MVSIFSNLNVFTVIFSQKSFNKVNKRDFISFQSTVHKFTSQDFLNNSWAIQITHKQQFWDTRSFNACIQSLIKFTRMKNSFVFIFFSGL